MKEHLAQLKIASERAAKEAEAEETEKIRVSWKTSKMFWAVWSAALYVKF